MFMSNKDLAPPPPTIIIHNDFVTVAYEVTEVWLQTVCAVKCDSVIFCAGAADVLEEVSESEVDETGLDVT